MSSLEIAERTGKRHDHVVRDIQAMLEGLGADAPSFGAVYRDAKGENRPCFQFPKRECLILVSGYSVELRPTRRAARQVAGHTEAWHSMTVPVLSGGCHVS